MQRKLPSTRRQAAIAAALALMLVAVGVQTFTLTRNVLTQLDRLSVTNTDNVQWNLIQSEVELMQLQLALSARTGSDAARSALVRQRFDIFYSRIGTFRESPLYTHLFLAAGSSEHLMQMTDFLNRWVPVIDGPAEALLQKFPEMEQEVKRLHGDVRGFVLLAMRTHAEQSDRRRDQVAATLTDLVMSALGLMAILIAGVVLLWRMYRRLRQVSREGEETRERLEAIVTSSLDAILVMRPDGLIEDYNGAATSLFGREGSCIQGHPVTKFIRDSDPDQRVSKAVPKLMRAARRGGDKRVLMDGVRRSGETFPAELSLSLSGTGDEELLVAFIRDISDRLRSENDLKQARDEALAAAEAKSSLLTVMSHEMRTPLNGVLGALDLLESQGITDQQARFVDAIRVSGDLLLHHVNDVLELSRLDANENTARGVEFDLEALVLSLVESQQPVARRGGNRLTVMSRQGPNPMVLGDPRLLQKSLLNLVGNALKFTRDGEVSVEFDRLGNGEDVEIRVTDTGLGIAPQDLERVFEEFVTLDTSYSRSSEGTGLGLAITQRMVAAMGGTIGAESEPGEGSLFWIRLPLPVVAQGSAPQVSSDQSAVTPSGPGLRILTVEDNDINRMLLTEMLGKLGHQVTGATDGFDGVKKAQRQSFDLIFMDISMPGMDGTETAARIAADGRNAETPVIALTAHAGADDRARFLNSGFARVLTKPFGWTDLEQAIAEFGAPEPVVDGETNIPEAVLGAERAAELHTRFQTELDAFRRLIPAGTRPGDAIRDEAHKLAGSAGVLGFGDLALLLNRVENLDGPVTPALVSELDHATARGPDQGRQPSRSGRVLPAG